MSVETLVNALDGLQNDAGRRQEYNLWLQEFQRSPKAWEVVYEVLESSDYSRALKIFSAQTLRNKVAFDIHQVPRDSRLHLKDQILLLLEKNVSLLSVVGVQLCVALAAFAMQVAEWDHPIEDLITRFDSAEMVPLLFEFLKVLPEEFNTSRNGLVDPSLRIQRSTSLIQNSVPLVLNFMMSRADIMAQSGSTQSLFFETLKPWLNEVDLQQIIASPLVDWILAGISNEEARSAAVDCMNCVLRETTEIHETVVQEAIQVLFPKIVGLAPVYSSHYEDDTELHRDLTRLFSEAAKSWHVLISKDPDNFMPLLQAVAQCVETPHADLETIEYTFDFFDKLRTVLGEPLPDSPPNPNEVPRAPFVTTFLNLFDAFVRLLKFPESFNGNQEEEELFRDFRYDIGDMLKICSSIAGHSETLHWCYERLHAVLTSSPVEFRSLEALLFAIRAIARTVPVSENAWLPKIYELFTQLSHIDNELVQRAALMLLGRYSQWSSQHPEYLEFELQYVISSVWSQHYEIRRAAAHAFLYICTDASKEMIRFLPQLLQFYGTLSGQVDLESLVKYSDGLGAIICHLQDDELANAINVVFTPVAERASALLTAGNPVVSEGSTTSAPNVNNNTNQNENDATAVQRQQQQQVGFDIQGIGSMIAMISVPELSENNDNNSTAAANSTHPLVVAVKSHHQLFTDMLVHFGPYDDVLLESISRYYIRILFNIGAALQNEIPLLLKAAHSCAAAKPISPYMFELNSAVVQCYNSAHAATPSLIQEVWNFSSIVCEGLFSSQALELLREEGGIVDRLTTISSVIYHGFHLLCDLAVYYPFQFFEKYFEAATLLSVAVFNYSWDTETLTATGHLYEDVESFAPNFKEAPVPEIRAKIEEVITHHGYQIVHAIFYLFLLKPDPYFEAMAERVVDFAFRLAPVASVSWVQQLLQTLSPGTVSDEEIVVFAQRVFQLLSANSGRIGKEMNEFVKAYAARNISPR